MSEAFWLAPSTRRRLRALSRALSVVFRLCLLALAGLALVGLIRYLAAFANFPFDIHPDEGRWVYKAWLLRNGKNIYPGLTDYPFLVTLYPPLYHWITAFVMVFTGPTMLAGRLVSILALFCVGIALFMLLRLETGQFFPSLIVAALAITSPWFAEYARVAKGDTLYIAFGLTGVFVFECFQKQRNPSLALPIFASFFLVAGVFTKQAGASFLFACMASAALRGRLLQRPFLAFCLASTALAAGAFLLLQGTTEGQFYRQAIVVAAQQTEASGGWSSAVLQGWLGRLWESHAGAILAGTGGLAGALRKNPTSRTHPLSIHLITLAPFAWNLLGSNGAHKHMLLPLIVTAYWFIGLLLARTIGRTWQGSALTVGLVVLALVPEPKEAILTWTKGSSFDYAAWFNHKNSVYERVVSVDGDILSFDDASFFLLSGKERLMDHYDLQIYRQSGLDIPGYPKIARDIRGRRFDLILETGAFIPDDLQPAVALAYELGETIGSSQILRPRSGYLIGITGFAEGPQSFDGLAKMDELIRHNVALSAREPFLGRVAEGPSWILYRLQAPSAIDRLTATGWPRVERSDVASAVIAEWSPDGVSFTGLWSLRADGGSGWTGIWETQSAGKRTVEAEALYLRFRLEGPNAQLWADPKHPIVVQVELVDHNKPDLPASP